MGGKVAVSGLIHDRVVESHDDVSAESTRRIQVGASLIQSRQSITERFVFGRRLSEIEIQTRRRCPVEHPVGVRTQLVFRLGDDDGGRFDELPFFTRRFRILQCQGICARSQGDEIVVGVTGDRGGLSFEFLRPLERGVVEVDHLRTQPQYPAFAHREVGSQTQIGVVGGDRFVQRIKHTVADGELQPDRSVVERHEAFGSFYNQFQTTERSYRALL